MAFQKIDLTLEQINALINLYANAFTDEEIATYFGCTEKALRNWLKKRDREEVRQRIEKAKVEAKVIMRQAVFQKARGTPYKAGRPKIIEDGKVKDEGEPAQVAIPGNLQAQQYWLENMDSKQWKRRNDFSFTTPLKEHALKVEGMSDKEIVDFVVSSFGEGIISDQMKSLLPKEETRESMPFNKIVDATFTEEKEEKEPQ
jgi:DNA-binding transcriptional MerR regulator